MTRKLLVKIIASFLIAQGLWDIGTSFVPIFTSAGTASLNLFAILRGALGMWAGIYLFQLSEFGRKFAMILLSLRIAYNLFFIGWALIHGDLSFTIDYFNRPMLESKSVYLIVLTLFVLLLITLGVIIFLSQKKTKAFFVSEATNAESGKPISESISNQQS